MRAYSPRRGSPHPSRNPIGRARVTIRVFACNYCGSAQHPAPYCPDLPDDMRAEFSKNVDSDRLDLEWGDAVILWTSPNRNDEAIFLGVSDVDMGTQATAALNVDEAARIGAELTLAAMLKRGQRV